MRVVSFAIAATMSAVPLAAFSQDATQGYKVAMDKMMADMHMQGTGDPDKDFAIMMMPHHQGAIDMAKVELQFGKDQQLRAMAQMIIDAQEKEIAEFKEWLAKHP
jgi:uncharacterized protein (DUF305 family)